MKKFFWILFISPMIYGQDMLMTNKTRLNIPIRSTVSDSVVITYNDGFYLPPIGMDKVKNIKFWNLQVGIYDLIVYSRGEIVEEKCIEIIPTRQNLVTIKND